jgi:hypothetical protein
MPVPVIYNGISHFPLRVEDNRVPRFGAQVHNRRTVGIVRAGTIRPGIPPDKDIVTACKVVCRQACGHTPCMKCFYHTAIGMPIPLIKNDILRCPLRVEGNSVPLRAAQVHNRRAVGITRAGTIRPGIPPDKDMVVAPKAVCRQACRHTISMHCTCHTAIGMPIPVIHNGIGNGRPLRVDGYACRYHGCCCKCLAASVCSHIPPGKGIADTRRLCCWQCGNRARQPSDSLIVRVRLDAAFVGVIFVEGNNRGRRPCYGNRVTGFGRMAFGYYGNGIYPGFIWRKG